MSNTTNPVRGAWVEMPRTRVQLDGTFPGPGSPKRAKVTGEAEVVFQRAGRAQVATNGAHVNDDNPALEFKGRRFLARVNFTRQEDGSWKVEERPYVTDRDAWGIADIPKTFTAAIVEALAHELEKAWTPEFDTEADRADIMRDLQRADREADEAAVELAKAEERQHALRQRLAAL